MRYQKYILVILFCTICIIGNAQVFDAYFIDSVNRAMDVSGFLNSPAGFMTVPIIITELALGFGI